MSETAAPKKEKKKLLNDKQQKIVDIVVTALEAVVIVVCLMVSILVWVGVADNPQNRKVNWFAIQSASMVGNNPDSLNPGDLMIAKKVNSIEDLKSNEVAGEGKGTVIAYSTIVEDAAHNKGQQIVTHRVNRIVGNQIYTKGDNVKAEEDATPIAFEDVIGAYSGKMKGIGKIILWLQGYKKVDTNIGVGYEATGKTTQFLIILIPLILLFVYNGYVVVKWIMDQRAKKIKEAAIAEAKAGAADEEAIKRAALVDFMKAQGMSDEDIEAYFAAQAPKAEPSLDSEAAEAEEAPAEEAEAQEGHSEGSESELEESQGQQPAEDEQPATEDEAPAEDDKAE